MKLFYTYLIRLGKNLCEGKLPKDIFIARCIFVSIIPVYCFGDQFVGQFNLNA